jgi:hypothetical protein
MNRNKLSNSVTSIISKMKVKMKKLSLILASLVVAAVSCGKPISTAPESSTQPTLYPSAETASLPSTKTASVLIPGVTATLNVKEPDLSHDPLYWFGPLPPLPITEGRPFIGSDDFMQLFNADAAWQTVSGSIQVFKLYGEWVGNHPGDAQLRAAINDLNRRGLAIAMESGPLDPDGCGEGIEGFATINSALRDALSIKSVGGTLNFIALDEPYYYGHFYDGTNACHWSAEKIAIEVDQFIQAVRAIFPDVIVGDTEPLAGDAGAKEYQDWLDVFYKTNGYNLAFLHMDIDWSRPTWTNEVKAILEHGRLIGVPVGVIYNGNAFDETDEAFLLATGERVKKLELEKGVQPDQVLFQSWNDKPDHVLPETDPTTYTGFIDQYFTDKASLGYKREGKDANLALGKSVRFSNQFSNFSGALAVDGDFGTLWSSGGGPVQWIEIDLGAVYSISEIRLTTSQYPEGLTTHRIMGKGPGTGDQFSLLFTFNGNTSDGDRLIFSPDNPIKDIRYIRIETVTSPSWVSWREIEIIDAGN